MRPSYIIDNIRGMYPGIRVVDEDAQGWSRERIAAPGNGFPYLIQGMKELKEGKMDLEWAELYSWYLRQEEYRGRVERLAEAVFLTWADEGLGKEIARALYGSVLENSVSRLERFAACAFSHFLMYGLKLEEREEYTFQPVDMGNIFHKVIELFS